MSRPEMPNLNDGAMGQTDGFASDGIPQVKAGDVVIYHFVDGDAEATVIRFTGIGANLDLNGTVIRDARRGLNVGQWEPISPRRSVASEK